MILSLVIIIFLVQIFQPLASDPGTLFYGLHRTFLVLYVFCIDHRVCGLFSVIFWGGALAVFFISYVVPIVQTFIHARRMEETVVDAFAIRLDSGLSVLLGVDSHAAKYESTEEGHCIVN